MQYLLSVCCFFKSDLHVFVVHNEAQVSPTANSSDAFIIVSSFHLSLNCTRNRLGHSSSLRSSERSQNPFRGGYREGSCEKWLKGYEISRLLRKGVEEERAEG